MPFCTRINDLPRSNLTCFSMSEFVTLLTHVRCYKKQTDYKIFILTFEVRPSWYLWNYSFSTCNNEWNEKKKQTKKQKEQTYPIKYEKKKTIGSKKFPIWGSAAVYFPGVPEPFYWTLNEIKQCFMHIYFNSIINSIICHSSESHKRTWKLSINVIHHSTKS